MNELPIILWLSILPPPVFKRALKNIKASEKKGEWIWGKVDSPALSLHRALYNAFNWDKSPEGHRYWFSIANHVYHLNNRPNVEFKKELLNPK